MHKNNFINPFRLVTPWISTSENNQQWRVQARYNEQLGVKNIITLIVQTLFPINIISLVN